MKPGDAVYVARSTANFIGRGLSKNEIQEGF
jgi:hypothetical protein